MSDYMFMLESHLNHHQNAVVNEITALANDANVNVYLAGGALRDMLGGFPIRDLDFTVEGSIPKLAQTLVKKLQGQILFEDPYHRFTEFLFPGDVTAQVAIAYEEKYAKPGGKPKITTAVPIWADLKRRDFTINGIALGLNRGSRGQLRDPNNGIADLESKELRASYSGIFADSPVRMLRVLRFKHRLGFVIEERTLRQFENAKLDSLQDLIPVEARLEELKQIAQEPQAAEILKDYLAFGLMPLLASGLDDSKLDLHAFDKLLKARRTIPQALFGRDGGWLTFLEVLTSKFSPKDRTEFNRNLGLDRKTSDAMKKFAELTKKLESTLKSARITKPSQIYFALEAAGGDAILSLIYHSQQRIVQDRVKNYLQKYLPAVQEPDIPIALGKQRTDAITKKLNARPKKIPPPEPVAVAPAPVPAPRGWSARRS